MKSFSILVLFLLVTVSYALAYGGTEVEGLGLMTSFFIAFGVLIVLYQFIPGLMHIGGLLKEIFSLTDRKITGASNK